MPTERATRFTFPRPSSSVGPPKKKYTVRRGKFAEIKKDHKMTTNSNTKSYQTTLVQDPEVLAKPMDQILH